MPVTDDYNFYILLLVNLNGLIYHCVLSDKALLRELPNYQKENILLFFSIDKIRHLRVLQEGLVTQEVIA